MLSCVDFGNICCSADCGIGSRFTGRVPIRKSASGHSLGGIHITQWYSALLNMEAVCDAPK
jgi:hypothetical protein